jgi:Zn-finger nucleic acid-binding protein
MYTKICPECNITILKYPTLLAYQKSIEKNKICKICKENKVYKRNCPSCGIEMTNSNKYNFQKAISNNSKCPKCRLKGVKLSSENIEKMRNGLKKYFQSERGKQQKEYMRNLYLNKTCEELYGEEKTKEIRRKQTENLTGEKNPFFGKHHSEKTRRIIAEKNKISSSGENNPMYGKPSPNGSGNGWSGWYKGWFFRSLRELNYMISVIERFNLEWKSAESKENKIPYTDYKGQKRNYFPDFIINNKYVVEIKPKKLHQSDSVLRKKESAEKWCDEKGFKYKLVDSGEINFENLLKLYEEGKIQFLPKYEEKFKDYKKVINEHK